jgi:prophage regulatory protein
MYTTLHCAQNSPSSLYSTDGFPSMNNRPIRFLRLPQVIDATGLGKTTIYELQGQGDFPMRVKITAHSVAWVEAEVDAWLAQRVAKGRAGLTPESPVIPEAIPSRVSRKRAR